MLTEHLQLEERGSDSSDRCEVSRDQLLRLGGDLEEIWCAERLGCSRDTLRCC